MGVLCAAARPPIQEKDWKEIKERDYLPASRIIIVLYLHRLASSACCRYIETHCTRVVCELSARCLRVVRASSARCPRVVCASSARRLCVVGVLSHLVVCALSVRCLCVVCALSSCAWFARCRRVVSHCQRVVGVLTACCLHFVQAL